MKKQILCAALAALLLAGCAGQAETAAGGTIAAEATAAAETTAPAGGISLADLEVPEKYTGDWSGVEGLVTVHADAKITLPEVDTIPIATVHRRSFTDEEAEAMISFMLGDGEFYKNYDGMTKAEAQAWLDRWKKIDEEYVPGSTASDHFTGNEDEDRQHIREKIAEAEQMLAEAPEEEPREINEKTFQKEVYPEWVVHYGGNENDTVVQGWGEKDGVRVDVSMDNWYDSESGAPRSRAAIAVEGYGDNTIVSSNIIELHSDPKNCSITRQEAIAAADELMEALGLTDMTCTEITGVVFPKDAEVVLEEEGPVSSDWEAIAGMEGGYELKYTRQVGKMTLTDLGVIGSKGGESKGHDGLFWNAETFTVAVADQGIVWFSWENPYTTPQVEETDQSLLPFDEIADVFERMIFVDNENLIDLNTRNQMTERLNFDIDEVQLGYIRVREYGNDQDGKFVPVWLFWGVESSSWESEEWGDGSNVNERALQFAINALDGSVIHASWQY